MAELQKVLAQTTAARANAPATWWAAAAQVYGQRMMPAYGACAELLPPGTTKDSGDAVLVALHWQAVGGKPDVQLKASDPLARAAKCVEDRLRAVSFDPHQAATVRWQLRLVK